MLCLDITWLTGTAFLAHDPSDHKPDWPPQPDRIFSALVASWGLGGRYPEERAALEWLEAQAPPHLHLHEPAYPRKTATVFVPTNDPGKLEAIPSLRGRQERIFPALALDPAARVHLSVIWTRNAPDKHYPALNAIARRTSYIGHSASLVRIIFRETDALPDGAQPSQRAPYPGRLQQLTALYERHMKGGISARPRPVIPHIAPPDDPAPSRSFSTDAACWFVYENADGERPDLRKQVNLAEAMRLALMEAWTQANNERAPAWISGHEADGSPARDPHLAIVPMANLGWEHADGRLMGLALIPPAAETTVWAASGPAAFARRQKFQRALSRLGEPDDEDRLILTLAPRGGGSWRWRLRPAVSAAHSLSPARYLRPARIWASATPVLLDRHLRSSGPPERSPEAEKIIRTACRREGLPEPEVIEITKHAAVSGSPSARPAGGNPRWSGWARRKSFKARPLVHVRLTFKEKVSGPVLIGAGRFHGLGLFLSVREERK